MNKNDKDSYSLIHFWGYGNPSVTKPSYSSNKHPMGIFLKEIYFSLSK